jgi:hypothetical protein
METYFGICEVTIAADRAAKERKKSYKFRSISTSKGMSFCFLLFLYLILCTLLYNTVCSDYLLVRELSSIALRIENHPTI